MTFKHLLKKKWWLRLVWVLVIAVYIVVVVFAAIFYIASIHQNQIVYVDDPLFESIDAPIEGYVSTLEDKRYKDYSYNNWFELGYLVRFLVAFTAFYSFALFVIWRISLYIIYGERLISRTKE